MEKTYQKQTLEAVELLKKLIATPSVSRDETAAADVLEAYMKDTQHMSCAMPSLHNCTLVLDNVLHLHSYNKLATLF